MNNMNKKLTIKVKKLDSRATFLTKTYASDAGYDLIATENQRINGGSSGVVKTGIALDIPNGYYGQISDRSSIARNHGLVTAGGVIDSGYHGEILVIMINPAYGPKDIYIGMKIAQVVFLPLAPLELEEVTIFEEKSNREEKGFGSSNG